MVSLAVLALEVIYVFVIIQMVELLDTAANIAMYLTSGASARIWTPSHYPKNDYFTMLLKVIVLRPSSYMG